MSDNETLEKLLWDIVEIIHFSDHPEYEDVVDAIDSLLDWHGFDTVGLRLNRTRNKRCVDLDG